MSVKPAELTLDSIILFLLPYFIDQMVKVKDKDQVGPVLNYRIKHYAIKACRGATV
jgi:hypothetical protein